MSKFKFRGWNNKNNIAFLVLFLGSGFICVLQLLFIPEARDPLALGRRSRMEIFNAEEEYYSISHPKFWPVLELAPDDPEEPGIIATMGRGNFARVNIYKQAFYNGHLDEVITWGKQLASRCESFEPENQTTYTNGSLSGIRFDYHCSYEVGFLSDEVKPSSCSDYYFYKKGYGYRLSFCSFDDTLERTIDTFQQMIDSFSLR